MLLEAGEVPPDSNPLSLAHPCQLRQGNLRSLGCDFNRSDFCLEAELLVFIIARMTRLIKQQLSIIWMKYQAISQQLHFLQRQQTPASLLEARKAADEGRGTSSFPDN